MKRLAVIFVFLTIASVLAFGDSGVLLPRDKNEPNPQVLSLADMQIVIVIDNGRAHVSVRQIFANHTERIEEGTYVFALPSRATVSDFAVWDGPKRIPAVILERKRAGEIYEQAKMQAIDPGLLQMGEQTSEARRSSVFSARIVPIAPYGTKRLELDYRESVPVENFKSMFAIALHPDAYQAQVAAHLSIHFEMRSDQDLAGFDEVGSSYPLKIRERSAHVVRGDFEGQNVALAEDFAVRYEIDHRAVDTINVSTYRNPQQSESTDPSGSGRVALYDKAGYFEAQALIGHGRAAAVDTQPKTIILAFDNSLSMQWDKLERSYAALERILRSMRQEDTFNLLLFNTKVQLFQPAPVPATRANVDGALTFVRASKLRGGTNINEALTAALKQNNGKSGVHVVLLTDGGATEGDILTGKIARRYGEQWKALPEGQRPRTYVFAVGDDANLPLLRLLARNDGVLENVLSTEPLEFKLNSFLEKIGRSPVDQLGMSASNADVQMVYPLQDGTFTGSVASWIGQYLKPTNSAQFTIIGSRGGERLELRRSATLPERSTESPELPRVWARARIDALLEKIERDGEDEKSVAEIIQLARRYKFVTPYTSFLAVPRALLRPRVIRPGDPILRVHTDEAIRSVVAIFPFGLTKRLRFLDGEKVWETRFLAPQDMQDGTYSVRLILRDNSGNTYRESKTFVIASKTPVITVKLATKKFRRGQTIPLKVNASASTRTLMARLDGAAPIELRWNQRTGASTGDIQVPPDLPVGTYRITVIAEDVAHNIGTQEVHIEVLP